MPRPVLITGGTGQLAQSLHDLALNRPVIRVGRPEFDFDTPDAITTLLHRINPALILNAAAYTAVDRAETENDAAWRANGAGPGLLASWCARNDAQMIHVSTDYVFDGIKGCAYIESDPSNPIGVYGASKRAGEVAVLQALPGAVVLRTSWVYAAHGKNFVRTMLNAARKTDRLRVVADQIGCPTATDDLAAAIWSIADRAENWPETGIFHAAGSGHTSWHSLAEAIFDEAAKHGHPRPTVEPIATADWPTPVRRPADSRLDCSRLERVFGLRLPEWRVAVAATVGMICRDDSCRSLSSGAV